MDGRLQGVSVNSGPNASLLELAATIPNRRVGVVTLAAIDALGGRVVPAPTLSNPFHCVLNDVTPQQAEQLFTPTVANPSVP